MVECEIHEEGKGRRINIVFIYIYVPRSTYYKPESKSTGKFFLHVDYNDINVIPLRNKVKHNLTCIAWHLSQLYRFRYSCTNTINDCNHGMLLLQ